MQYRIATNLADIFSRSKKTGDVPANWHDTNISPVFTKGKPDDPANYRPISLTSFASKLLEHIIHKSIMDHLDYRDLLSNVQHGVRRECSCETQLASVIQDLVSSVGSRCQTDAIILDFSKAFDMVTHKFLFYKLDCYWISGETLAWNNNFLSCHHQSVILDGTTFWYP